MTIKKTVTSIFFVPTLKIDAERQGILNNNGFINAYIRDDRREIQYEDSIYLLFKPEDIEKFREFLDDEYERTRSIIDDYNYEDGFVVIVYKLNPRFEKDFKLIKEGKYSQTSLEFQELFPKMIKIMRGNLPKNEVSLQYRVFNKTEDMMEFWENKLGVEFNKNMEVWSGFELEQETLTLEKIKEYV